MSKTAGLRQSTINFKHASHNKREQCVMLGTQTDSRRLQLAVGVIKQSVLILLNTYSGCKHQPTHTSRYTSAHTHQPAHTNPHTPAQTHQPTHTSPDTNPHTNPHTHTSPHTPTRTHQPVHISPHTPTRTHQPRHQPTHQPAHTHQPTHTNPHKPAHTHQQTSAYRCKKNYNNYTLHPFGVYSTICTRELRLCL